MLTIKTNDKTIFLFEKPFYAELSNNTCTIMINKQNPKAITLHYKKEAKEEEIITNLGYINSVLDTNYLNKLYNITLDVDTTMSFKFEQNEEKEKEQGESKQKLPKML